MDKCRYKGRFATKKQYDKLMKAVETGKNTRKRNTDDAHMKVHGLRIVDIEELGKNFICSFCKKNLSFLKIEKEQRRGLASIFSIRCEECLLLNHVPTGKVHLGPAGVSRFDTNTKLALGAMHAGVGAEKLNKVFQVMDLPGISSKTLKQHEREIGPIVERVAEDSCKESCETERSLTLKNLESLNKLLPQNVESIDHNFLTPINSVPIDHACNIEDQRDNNNNNNVNNNNESKNCDDCNNNFNNRDDACKSDLNNNCDNKENKLVRVFASFDAAWSTRGAGRQYDSLNGYSTLIGKESGLILDYATRNRVCEKCRKGHDKSTHDCRENFSGSAKAMEPDMAVQLVTKSKILQEKNINVGVFIGDNDSASICNIRRNSNYTVLKQSDKNHTKKGVGNILRAIKKENDPDKEMNTEVINYLVKCFSYAIMRNSEEDNTQSVAESIRNIPFLAFNYHENCKEWCRYKIEKDNYKHRTIGEGLKNQILFDELRKIFNNIAKNADTFSSGASTQANESFNGCVARRMPKSESYSRSETADFRVASVVAQKNIGENYLANTINKYGLQSGNILKKRIVNVTKTAKARALRAKTPQFKRNRQRLRKKRSQLKNRREQNEGITYEKNIGLINLDEPTASDKPTNSNIDNHIANDEINGPDGYQIVFFDLETGGFQFNADVLQIAMKCNNLAFNMYISPTQSIPGKVSEVNNLTNVHGELYLRGVMVVSHPKKIVLYKLLEYLQKVGNRCVLIAHNCSFDAPRLLKLIDDTSLLNEFKNIITGFVDSLKLFRNKFPERKSKGQLKLTTIASDTLNLTPNGAHDALNDVIMLDKVTLHHFNKKEVLAIITNFEYMHQLPYKKERIKKIVKTLEPLNDILSKVMIEKIASANITYDKLVTTYKKSAQDAIELVQQKVNNKAQVIKNKTILNSILKHLKSLK